MEEDERTPLLKQHHNTAGLSATRFRLICAATWGCTFFAAFDSTVLAALTSDIASSFNASNRGSWLGTAYLLAFCCCTPIYGRLADILGRRGAHAVAMSFFTLGVFGCAVAPTMNTLLLAILVAGMGGGGVQNVSVIILTDIVDLRHRGLLQGYGNIVFGMASALGGPVGGWLSDTFGWRTAYGIQVVPLVIAGVMVWTIVGPALGKDGQEQEVERWQDKARRIDYLGCLTLILAVASLILALSIKTSSAKQGGDYTWSDPLIVGLFVSSLAGSLLFVFVEKRAIQPLLPLSLLTRQTPLAVALSCLTVATNQFSILYNIPLFFSTVKLSTASVAGMHILPYSALMGFGSVMTGLLIRRTGRYWIFIVGSAGIIVISQIMLATWSNKSPAWITWVAQMPSGLGYAGVLTGTLVALMNEVDKSEIAVATSMSYLFRSVGQVLGVSLSSALVQSVLSSELAKTVHDPLVIGIIRKSTDQIRHLEPVYREAAVSAYGKALHYVFVANLILSIISLGPCFLTREEPL